MTPTTAEPKETFTLTLRDFEQARERIAPHIYRTPLLTSRQLSEATGLSTEIVESLQTLNPTKD